MSCPQVYVMSYTCERSARFGSAVRRQNARCLPLLRRKRRPDAPVFGDRRTRQFHRYRHLQERPECPRHAGGRAARPVHTGNRLSLSGPGALLRPALRTGLYKGNRRNGRAREKLFAGRIQVAGMRNRAAGRVLDGGGGLLGKEGQKVSQKMVAACRPPGSWPCRPGGRRAMTLVAIRWIGEVKCFSSVMAGAAIFSLFDHRVVGRTVCLPEILDNLHFEDAWMALGAS